MSPNFQTWDKLRYDLGKYLGREKRDLGSFENVAPGIKDWYQIAKSTAQTSNYEPVLWAAVNQRMLGSVLLPKLKLLLNPALKHSGYRYWIIRTSLKHPKRWQISK